MSEESPPGEEGGSQDRLHDDSNAGDSKNSSPDQPKYRDENWLREQYWEKGKTQQEIGEMVDVHPKTIRTWMDKHGIERRSKGEASAYAQLDSEARKKLNDEDWLREQHLDEMRTCVDIADELNVSASTVKRYLNKHDIDTLGRSMGAQLANLPKDTVKRLRDEDWLREQYVEGEQSCEEIADELCVSSNAVSEWMHRHGIEMRSTSEARTISELDDEAREKLNDAEWMEEQYWSQKRTTTEIARDVGVAPSTVREWMERHNIPRRQSGEGVRVAFNSPATNEKLDDKEWLETEYIEEGRSTIEIAAELDISPETVRRYLGKHGIERRERWNRIIEPSESTEPEEILWGILEDLGVEYEDEAWICGNSFRVDAFVPDEGLIIEADGDYYHAHPNKCSDDLDEIQKNNLQSEFGRDAAATRQGYTVLRIWERDLCGRTKDVKRRIKQILKGTRRIDGAGSLDSAYLFSDNISHGR